MRKPLFLLVPSMVWVIKITRCHLRVVFNHLFNPCTVQTFYLEGDGMDGTQPGEKRFATLNFEDKKTNHMYA